MVFLVTQVIVVIQVIAVILDFLVFQVILDQVYQDTQAGQE